MRQLLLLTLFFQKRKRKIRLNNLQRDFPGGPLVKNPPSNAGYLGSICGRELRFPHALEQ